MQIVGRQDAYKILTMKAWHHNNQDQYALCLGSKALYLETCRHQEVEPQLVITEQHLKDLFEYPYLREDLLHWSYWISNHFHRHSPGLFGWDYNPIPNVFCLEMWPAPWPTLSKNSRLKLKPSGASIVSTVITYIQSYYSEHFPEPNPVITDQIVSRTFLEPAIVYLFLQSLDEEEEDGSAATCDFVFNYSATDTVEKRCREFAAYLEEEKQQQSIQILLEALLKNTQL